MTWATWIQVVQGLVMAAVVMILWGVRKAWRGGSDETALLLRLTQIEARMERAGKLMSDFADQVQALPERLRKEFVRTDLVDQLRAESERDRARIWDEVRRLQDEVRR